MYNISVQHKKWSWPLQIWCVCCWARRRVPGWRKTGCHYHEVRRLPWQPNLYGWSATWSETHPAGVNADTRRANIGQESSFQAYTCHYWIHLKEAGPWTASHRWTLLLFLYPWDRHPEWWIRAPLCEILCHCSNLEWRRMFNQRVKDNRNKQKKKKCPFCFPCIKSTLHARLC